MVGRDDALEVVGQVGAPRRLAPAVVLVLEVVGLGQMQHARQLGAERLAVVADAADARAAESGAVVAPLPAHEAGAGRFALGMVVGKRDLQGRIHRLGSRVREEHRVEIPGRHRRQSLGQSKHRRMGDLERRRVVEFRRLAPDRLDDTRMAVPGVAAPEPGHAVENLPTVVCPVASPRRRHQQPGVALERPVRRERQPVGVERQLVVQAGHGIGPVAR